MVPTTLMIDRRYRGIGRIKRASGTKIPAVKRKLERMMEALHSEGRLDILRLIRDGKLTLLEVHDAYQRKAIDQLPTGDTMALVSVAMGDWIDSLRAPADYSAHHIATMRTTRRYLAALNPNATLAALPSLLDELRDSKGKKHPRSFNLARAHVMAFVRATLKKNHPLWLACSAVEVRKVAKTTKRRPLTPDAMRNWFPSPETDPLDAIAWGMATTGMHQKEYWGRWEILADRIRVYGTKREGRQRSIPLVHRPAAPQWATAGTFEKKLRLRTRDFTPYDLRRTYANWMESSGIPRTRRRLYIGHGVQDVLDLYEAHEVAAFLAEDGQKLRAFIGLPDPAAVRRLEAVR
jgi:hypothetical protein